MFSVSRKNHQGSEAENPQYLRRPDFFNELERGETAADVLHPQAEITHNQQAQEHQNSSIVQPAIESEPSRRKEFVVTAISSGIIGGVVTFGCGLLSQAGSIEDALFLASLLPIALVVPTMVLSGRWRDAKKTDQRLRNNKEKSPNSRT